ncbi:hypothetical protein [Sphingomonas sp. YL-JM2C]
MIAAVMATVVILGVLMAALLGLEPKDIFSGVLSLGGTALGVLAATWGALWVERVRRRQRHDLECRVIVESIDQWADAGRAIIARYSVNDFSNAAEDRRAIAAICFNVARYIEICQRWSTDLHPDQAIALGYLERAANKVVTSTRESNTTDEDLSAMIGAVQRSMNLARLTLTVEYDKNFNKGKRQPVEAG